jgi:hypothetical protein
MALQRLAASATKLYHRERGVNAFYDALKVEEKGMRYLFPFLKSYAHEGQIVRIAKGDLAEKLQQEIGDVLLNSKKDQSLLAFELKIEERNPHGNLFLETWSNKSRQKPGWMCNELMATWLGYFFIKEQDFYIIRLSELRQWAFQRASKLGRGCRIEDFEEKEQNKRQQLNDTWGRCVPITILKNETALHHCQVNHNQLVFLF